MYRKTLSILAVLVLALAVLATGCQSATPTATVAPTSAAKTDAGNGLMVPLADTLTTITALISNNEGGKDWSKDDFPILDAVQKITNVKLAMESYSSTAYGQILSARLSAKYNLPDMFVCDQRSYDFSSLQSSGTIQALNTLIAADAPNLVAMMAKDASLKNALTTNSIIYAFPGQLRDQQFDVLLNMYRQDWVDALIAANDLKFSDSGSAPKTIDDWTAMLTAFKTYGDVAGGPTAYNKANGNVDKIIPFELWHMNKLNGIAVSYGLSEQSDWFSTVNGAVVYDWTDQQDNMKAFLKQMNSWYKSGLLDPQYGLNLDIESYVYDNRAGVDCEWTGYASYWNTNTPNAMGVAKGYTNEKVPTDSTHDTYTQHWSLAQAAIANKADGTPYVAAPGYEGYPLLNYVRWVVSGTAKDPALVVKYLDFLFGTKQGQTLMNYGIQGTDYTLVDGKPVFTDTVLKATGGAFAYLAAEGSSRLPMVQLYDQNAQLSGWNGATGRMATFLTQLQTNLKAFRVFFPSIPYTSDQVAQIGTKASDINTLVSTYLVGFIRGTYNVDTDYASLVSQIKAAGIDTVKNVKTTQYAVYTAG